MSTNYYWHTGTGHPSAHCATCTCRDKWVLHIGHFACGGWSFQGHFADCAHGHQLTSWAQWKAALLSGGRIRSESGYWVPAANLIADIENVAPAGRRRQYDWLDARRGVYGERMDEVAPGYDWLDADGFSFHGGEFS